MRISNIGKVYINNNIVKKPFVNRFKHIYNRLARDESFNIEYKHYGVQDNDLIVILDSNNQHRVCFLSIKHFCNIEMFANSIGEDIYDIMKSVIEYMYSPLFTTRSGYEKHPVSISMNLIINIIYYRYGSPLSHITLNKYLTNIYNKITKSNISHDELLDMMTDRVTGIDGAAFIGVESKMTSDFYISRNNLDVRPCIYEDELNQLDKLHSELEVNPYLYLFYNRYEHYSLTRSISLKFTSLILTKLFSNEIRHLLHITNDKKIISYSPDTVSINDCDIDTTNKLFIKPLDESGYNDTGYIIGNMYQENDIVCMDISNDYSHNSSETEYYIAFKNSLDFLVSILLKF